MSAKEDSEIIGRLEARIRELEADIDAQFRRIGDDAKALGDAVEEQQRRAEKAEAERDAIAAERGATDRQLMAMFGWESAREATKYTASADRKRLAADAARLIGDQSANDDCLTELSHLENK